LQRDYSAIEERSRSTGCEPRLSILSVCRGLDIPTANQVAARGHLIENANHAFLDAVRKSERKVRAQSASWFGPRARRARAAQDQQQRWLPLVVQVRSFHPHQRGLENVLNWCV
jgi:hypothetical protein